MAKLKFYYGVMGSSKSLRLLIQKHDLEAQGKKVLVIKPDNDTRDGQWVKSRIGLKCKVDLMWYNDYSVEVSGIKWTDYDFILADEVQFFKYQIRILRKITLEHNIPVTCYGLKTDFKGELFYGSRELLSLADEIEEIPTICKKCLNKATFNMRIDKDGKKVTEGPQVDVGGDEKYIGVCADCYYA